MIPELLQRWSSKQPTVCRKFLQVFAIDIYHFWVNDAGEFSACLVADLGIQVSGQPALDWLEGATSQSIEITGCEYRMESYKHQAQAMVFTFDDTPNQLSNWESTSTEALLTAWVEYLEGQ